MKKNYNYNYVNRTTAQKSAVEFGNVELASCTSATLKNSPISNGSLWHTTDTNEFYYDWNGKRNKLNLTGDSASVTAEINKIKSDVAKLNPEKLDQLETKVNNAVSKVNTMSSKVNNAVSTAQAASQAAQSAASQVTDKVNTSDLAPVATSGSYNDLTGKPNLNNYAKKTDLNGLASESWVEGKGYLTQHQSLSEYAKKTDIPDVSDFASKSEIPDVSGFATKSEIPSVDGLASESWVEGKGYLTSHQDISGKADKSELPSKVSDLTNDAGYITANDLPDYLTDSDLPDVTEGAFPSGADVEDASASADGLATVQDVMDYVRAYFEKKKDELEPVESGKPYAYITGYGLSDTATDITQFNPFELNESGDTVIEFYGPQELPLYDQNDNELPCLKVTIDIPTGYEITDFKLWNAITNEYQDTTYGQNQRYSTRTIGGVTYNSHARGPVSSISPRGTTQYKITITKQ